MATFDGVTTDAGSGGSTFAVDSFTDSGGNTRVMPFSALAYGAIDSTYTVVSSSAGLPVAQQGTWTVDLGATDNAVLDAIAASLAGTLTVGSHAVTDGGSSLTVDAPVGTPVFVRLSDGSAAISTLPVSLASVPSHAVTNAGTFAVQAAQSGTWTVDLGATDNAVLDSILSALQGTLTVGSHAVTNAGTFAVQVDGSALTALQLIDDVVYVDDADWTATTSKHTLIGGVYQSTPGTITDGDTGPLRVNANGALHVAIVSGGGSGGTSATDDAAFTAGSGTGTPLMGFVTSDAVDAGDVGVVAMLANRQLKVSLYDSSGNEVSVGGGTQYDEDSAHVSGDKVTMAGVVRADTAAAQSGTDGDRTVLITDASGRLHVNVGNTVTVASHAVTNAGTFAVQAEQSGTWNITNISGTVSLPTGAATAAKQPAIGTAGTASADVITIQGIASMTAIQVADNGSSLTVDNGGTFVVQPRPETSGGLTIFRTIDLDESEEEVKASAGQVYGWYFFNASTSIRYLKFYNATAANTTVGTTTPVMTIPLPAASSGGVGANVMGALGIAFDTAITVAATTGLGDSDTGAPGANEVILNLWYS